MNSLQGKPVDRPPVLATLCAYGGKLTGVPLPELYTNADQQVAGQQAVVEVFNNDIVFSSFDASVLAEAFGSEIAFFEHQPPNMKRPAVNTQAEALALPLPDPHTTGRLPMVLDATRKLAQCYKKTVPVACGLPGPDALPVLIMGLEHWLENALFDEPAAQQLMERTGSFWVQWANLLFEAGADCLVISCGLASENISTRAFYEKMFIPHLRHCFAQVNGRLILHHGGGAINHVIDLLADLPNLGGIVVSSRDDLVEARAKAGPGVPLLGSLDNLSFPAVSADTIREQATACLQTGLRIQHFLLSNAGADIPIQTPPENIHALFEATELFAAQQAASTLWVVCGVLEAEIRQLLDEGKIGGRLLAINSMLHMDPPALQRKLEQLLEEQHRPLVLVYGDCCPAMLQLAERPNVVRVDSCNCCEILLGKERFRELMRRHAFLLLPEWMPRWKTIIEQELKLSIEVARDLFNEECAELVLLDTGINGAPEEEELEACAAYVNLPFRIEQTGLNHLLHQLTAAEAQLKQQDPTP